MKKTAARNFHVPLTEPVYQRLRTLAEQQRRPATQVVKQAVEYWLDEQERLTLHEEIAAYAAQAAGTSADLDTDLEAAALEHLDDLERDR